MDKYIGFDIDGKKTVVCVVQKDKTGRYTTFKTDIGPDFQYPEDMDRGNLSERVFLFELLVFLLPKI